MKTSEKILAIIGLAVGIFLIISIKQCNNPTDSEVVNFIVPEKKGYFNIPPIYTPKENQKDSVIYKYRTVKNNDTVYVDSIIYTENPVNKQLAKQYSSTKDSLQKYKLYLKAIEEREGTSVFDNEDLKLEVYTKTRGELLDIKPTYTIKERTVTATVPTKQNVFAMYVGGEVVSTDKLDKVGIKADIGLQNRSGNMLTIGIDNNKNYYLGAKFRLFNIKK